MLITKRTCLVMFCLAISIGLSFAITIDELGKTTVYLREQMKCYEMKGAKKYEIWLKDIENQQSEPKIATKSGTGFLISHHKQIYLVTASHIARNMSNKAEIIWNTASGKVKFFTFEELQNGLPSSMWFFHRSADIAVHPFGFTEKPGHIFVPEEVFASEDDIIPLGTKVYVLGFPLNLGIKEILSPISKKAEIASWLTSIDFSTIQPNLKFILLDEDLATGYSGAPVFISPEPQIRDNAFVVGGIQSTLIGIQSMTISDKTGGKMSLVVPISYLHEIFSSKDFKEYEKRIGIK